MLLYKFSICLLIFISASEIAVIDFARKLHGGLYNMFIIFFFSFQTAKGKDSFYPPSLFLSGICFSDVFSDYKTFLLWRFSWKCIISEI